MRKIKVFLSGIVNSTNAQNLNCRALMRHLDIARLVREVLPRDAMVSVETVKNSRENLDDFKSDVNWLRVIADG